MTSSVFLPFNADTGMISANSHTSLYVSIASKMSFSSTVSILLMTKMIGVLILDNCSMIYFSPPPMNVLGSTNQSTTSTSFNVRSYPADQEYTTLESGRVSIHCLGQDCLLRPGEQLRLSDTSVVIVPVRSENYIGWKNQCWVYDNCMLKEVFKDLERWYNVQIELEDESIGLRHFTGNFRRYDNINTVLEMIGLVAHVKYEVEGREIVFSWK